MKQKAILCAMQLVSFVPYITVCIWCWDMLDPISMVYSHQNSWLNFSLLCYGVCDILAVDLVSGCWQPSGEPSLAKLHFRGYIYTDKSKVTILIFSFWPEDPDRVCCINICWGVRCYGQFDVGLITIHGLMCHILV